MPILTQKTKRRLTKAQLTKKIKKNLGHIIQLDPNSVTFAATSGGTVSNYSPGQTTIKVYQGTGSLTPSSTLASNNTFKVEVGSDTNITAPSSLTYGASAVTTNNPSSMTADQAHIDWTVTVKDLTGTEVEYEVKQNFAKAKAGTNGTNGTDGTDGTDGTAGRSYVSVSGSVASALLSGGSTGHWVPSNGSTAPADGWNITSGLIIGRDNDNAGSHTSPLTLDHTVGEPKETLIAVVPSGETWTFKRLSGIITTTTTRSATPAIEGRLALYETDRTVSSMSASEDVVLMDNYATLDIDHSGAGTVVTSFSISIDEAVTAGYGILPVLYVSGIDSGTSAVSFTWTLEFVVS